MARPKKQIRLHDEADASDPHIRPSRYRLHDIVCVARMLLASAKFLEIIQRFVLDNVHLESETNNRGIVELREAMELADQEDHGQPRLERPLSVRALDLAAEIVLRSPAVIVGNNDLPIGKVTELVLMLYSFMLRRYNIDTDGMEPFAGTIFGYTRSGSFISNTEYHDILNKYYSERRGDTRGRDNDIIAAISTFLRVPDGFRTEFVDLVANVCDDLRGLAPSTRRDSYSSSASVPVMPVVTEKYSDRAIRSESPEQFILRVYGDPRDSGITQADLARSDPKLYQALRSWKLKHRLSIALPVKKMNKSDEPLDQRLKEIRALARDRARRRRAKRSNRSPQPD